MFLGFDIGSSGVKAILLDLARAPLGLHGDDAFRISIAGAQEKTALLRDGDRWLRPVGTTPTTHILKPQIGHIETSSGTIDLTNSVENEWYCLKLLETLGLEVNRVEMASFGRVRVLVIERFDRLHTRDGRLIRLPQEDCCQALSVPPTRKYQSEGGPGIADIVKLLGASDRPGVDQLAFFKAQIIFWLIGATDGHAKNFSVALLPGGRFHLTPFYDVLTAQPSVDSRQVPQKAFKLAMSIGGGRYRIADIHGRHFVEIGRAAGRGFAFDSEALLVANRLGYRVAEVPIRWSHKAGSKVNMLRDGTRMLCDLATVRWLHRALKSGESSSPVATVTPPKV